MANGFIKKHIFFITVDNGTSISIVRLEVLSRHFGVRVYVTT